MTHTPPPETPEQRAEGLVNALAARRARAAIKDQVKAGTLTVGDVLAAAKSDQAHARMKVIDLVEALDGIGPVKAAEALDAAGVNHGDRLDQLGANQVESLTASLG